ncbi:SGNH/GDSL hydrolase family protein [Virgibacillus sp. L01]|uniref:SGNH/GDSL hydrolase family protein n=1 Tax=Virgibacillus sp. L01 TaxID=3457429 RepID=UPI003FD1B130
MKKLVKLLILILVAGLLFTTPAVAKGGNAKESLVSLGDSIPYGYNLNQHNKTTSKDAFPYLMGDTGDLRVRNLGVPGWTTSELLASMQSDQKYRQAVRHADYITLTIGNNDLLQALQAAQAESGSDPLLFMAILQQKISDSNVFGNIGKIIKEARSLSDAPIVIFNVYNPFQADDPSHDIGSLVLPGINKNIADLTAGYNARYGNILLADAYAAFDQSQQSYVIPGDIHPTIEGQIKLAEIGLDALGLNE